MEVGVEAHELWGNKDEVTDLLRQWEKNELVSEFKGPCMNEIAIKVERRSEDDERCDGEVEKYWSWRLLNKQRCVLLLSLWHAW